MLELNYRDARPIYEQIKDGLRIKLSLQYFFQLLIGDTVSLFCLIFSPLIKILQIADTIITTIQMSYEIVPYQPNHSNQRKILC